MTANIDLTVAALVAEAERRSGLHDFGSEDFSTPLQALLNSLNAEANLNALGRSLQPERLIELLINRLRLEHFVKCHPEILNEPIEAPIVIVGLPRSGTTMLQRILSVDTRLLSTRWYEMRFPAPAFDWNFDPANDARIGKAKAEVQALIAANPDLLSMHPLDAIAADEDLMLLENTFYSVMPGSQAYVPSYNVFFEHSDTTAAYRYHKKLLQFLQWQRRHNDEAIEKRRWVLKSPAHMHEIAALFSVYPDALILQSHRDPMACMPSISSLYFAVWKIYSDHADPQHCGAYTTEFYARALRRTAAAKKNRPTQFHDFAYNQLATDPDTTLAAIYDFIGLSLSASLRQKMQQWRDINRREQRAQHKYELAEYGLSETKLRAAFADFYVEHEL
jgi:hypothetical protein